MKMAIFAILIISLGIMVSASPESHASDLDVSHIIENIDHHLDDGNIYNSVNSTSHLPDNTTGINHMNQSMENKTNLITMPIDVDNTLLSIY